MKTRKTTHSICSKLNEIIKIQCDTCGNSENCPFLKETTQIPVLKIYNEHISTLSHELRSPLAVINSSTISQINYLRELYRNLLDTIGNYDRLLIKKIKEQIFLVEEQVKVIENVIKNISEYRNYNSSGLNETSTGEYLINVKRYLTHILQICPSYSHSMAIFSKNIGFGDTYGRDFENMHIIVNPLHLNQIIMNIVTNAGDAVSEAYKTKSKEDLFYLPYLKIRCIKPKNHYQTIKFKSDVFGPFGYNNPSCKLFIIIEDNGSGFKSEHLDRLLKYGGTTKDNDNHYGLGLTVCQKLSERNKISFFIKTNNEGTKFILGFNDIIIKKINEGESEININDNSENITEILNFTSDSEKIYNELVECESISHDTHSTSRHKTDKVKILNNKSIR